MPWLDPPGVKSSGNVSVPSPTHVGGWQDPPGVRPSAPPTSSGGGGGGHSVGGFFSNLAGGIEHAATGLGPGLANVATAAYHEIIQPPWTRSKKENDALLNIAKQAGRSYADTYGHGFRHFLEAAYHDPLQPILDAAAIASGGGTLAAKLVPELGRAGELSLATRTGEQIVKRSDRNPVKRAVQVGSRKATTGTTGKVEQLLNRELPVVGEHARAVRGLDKQLRRRQQVQIAKTLKPFRAAFGPLKADEKVAVVFSARGILPSELRATIEGQVAKAGTKGEIADHNNMLKLIDRVPDSLVESVRTDPKLAAARQAADDLSSAGADVLQHAGLLTDESRALRPYLSARLVGGARFDKAAGEFKGGPPVEQIKQELGDLIYHPDTGPGLREGQIPQRMSGSAPPKVPGLTKQNQGVRFLASRWLPHPQAWQDAYLRTIGYAHAKQRGELALRVAKQLGPEGEKNDGWYYVRAGSQKPGRAATERAAMGNELDKIIENGDHNIEGWLNDNIVSPNAEVKSRWEKEGSEVRQISPGDYKQLFGQFKGTNMLVKNLIDRPTNFWRALTLNYRPAWLVNNLVGQTLLYALNHSGPGGAAAYARSVHDTLTKSDRYFPEDLQYGFFQSERSFTAGPRSVRTAGNLLVQKEAAMRDALNRLNATLSDNIPRRAAWYAVAQKEKGWLDKIDGTNRTLDQFLEELKAAAENPAASPRLAQLHEEMVQQVLDELIDFGNLSHFERSVIRRILPFYSWIKGIMLATARLGFHHPLKSAVLAQLGKRGAALNMAAFGAGSSIIPGDYPLGPEKNGEIRTLGTSGLNPWATVGQTVKGLGSIGGMASGNADNPLFQMNPVAQGLVAALTKRDPFTGNALTGGQLQILLTQLLQAPAPVSAAWHATHLPTGAAAQKKMTKPSAMDMLFGYLGLPVHTRRPAVAARIAQLPPR